MTIPNSILRRGPVLTTLLWQAACGEGGGETPPTTGAGGGDPPALQITAVSTQLAHLLALGSDGTVRAFGASDRHRLGDGTVIDRLHLAPVIGLNAVAAEAL